LSIANFDCLTLSTWSRIGSRLRFSPQLTIPEESAERYNVLRFPYSADQPFNDLIASLTTKYSGNVHDYGAVSAIASSEYSTSYLAKFVHDLEQRSCYFCSKQEKGSWIGYNFHSARVVPSHYEIRSHPGCGGEGTLKSWVMEGSMDGSTNWEKLDEQTNNSLLLTGGSVAAFPVNSSRAYRALRIRQTGLNHNGNDYLAIAALEIYGQFFST
jgi:hypothetical protein